MLSSETTEHIVTTRQDDSGTVFVVEVVTQGKGISVTERYEYTQEEYEALVHRGVVRELLKEEKR